jgi:pilus assembly protein Flp/PilA
MKVIAHIKAFLKDEEGASGIEYAMIAGMVAVVLAASSASIRGSVSLIFSTVATKLALVATATP